MSTVANESGTTPANTPLTPEELVAQVRAIQGRIAMPDPAPAPVSLRRRLAHVHPDFVNASINAAGVSETVQSALGRTDEDLREETDTTARWTAAADAIAGLYQIVRGVIQVRRQRSGLAALQTYQICRQLARDERHATRLAPHLEEMKRLNRFGRRRGPKTPPEDVALAKQAQAAKQ